MFEINFNTFWMAKRENKSTKLYVCLLVNCIFREVRGGTQVLKVHSVGAAKSFCDILPQKCVSILWHDHVMGGDTKGFYMFERDNENFQYIQGGGVVKVFTTTKHFNMSPPPFIGVVKEILNPQMGGGGKSGNVEWGWSKTLYYHK